MSDRKKVGETSSGEVVNGFRSCRDLSDTVPLYAAQGIYLKPIAKIHVSINLPQLKTPGKTISTWEVMEKLRLLTRPDEFVSLKVVKSTLEFFRFEGDLGDKSRLRQVLARLDGQRLNLAGFPNVLKVKAAEIKDDFPTRHSWDSYFRDAKNMNELKAGERPDTIHISGLPVKWFSEDDGKTPSESLISKIFRRYGNVKRVDVPASDPYRSRMRLGKTVHTFNHEEGIFFDAYIQYFEYMDFVKAMDALRGMKLLKKDKEKNHLVAGVKVDFDKTKHMSDNSVSHREFERKRLIAQDNLAAEKLRRKEETEAKKREELKKKKEKDSREKDSRRRVREEKRKRKALTTYRKKEEDIVSMKIAREERKLIEALRELEGIRLLDALFDRIKIKVEKNEIDIRPKPIISTNDKDSKTERKTDSSSKEEGNKKDKKKDKKEKKKKKNSKKKKDINNDSSDESIKSKKIDSLVLPKNGPYIPPDLSLDNRYFSPWLPTIPMLPPQALYRGYPRGRSMLPGRIRSNRGRGRQFYPPIDSSEYNEMYYEYFSNLVGQDYIGPIDKRNRSNSRSRNRRGSRSRSRSRVRRKHISRSRSRSKSPVNSKKRRRSLTKSRSRSRGRSRTRRRSSSRSRNSSNKKYPRSRTKSRSKSRRRSKNRHRSRSRSRRRQVSRVRITRAKSRTVSPRKRSRSSSWSLPKSPRSRSCSWSKTVDESTEKKTDPIEDKSLKCDAEQEESLTPKAKRTEENVTNEQPLIPNQSANNSVENIKI